ncbi:DUF1476 domain-containing protein [Elstera cyanobacteriorum]|uniref:Aldolase n=1 Tax=Elstera cyanobacteriorum TaxID=2022747 RepID=A0A255XJ30_9PROT|nr:DUF1476 domain-containing protein [Elstera cyanobacteriorum]MCK6443892.1 DUF1476 domain-containing protein [Elstera cyanobacteriorum]OYQ16976.1 hypothetical protein CHR90_18620 [Elstera cyanobacteriorum]GFZ89882.1 aldolase [Elstera cyanobacteriorum]
MTKFEDRERAFEAHFALEQDQLFRAMVRRDKLFGLWAAERMGLPAAEADMYAKGLIDYDIEHPGDEDILERVADDLAARGVHADLPQLRVELDRLHAVAKSEILGQQA